MTAEPDYEFYEIEARPRKPGTCEECRFWKSSGRDLYEMRVRSFNRAAAAKQHHLMHRPDFRGTCHVNPPTIQGFPATHADDFCGRIEEKP